MDSNPHDDGLEQETSQEGIQQQPQKPRPRKIKPLVRKRIFRWAGFAVCFGLAQYFDNPVHKFICFTIAFVFGFFALRIELLNNEGTKDEATFPPLALFLLAEAVAAYVCFLQPKSSLPNQKPSPPQNADLMLGLQIDEDPATEVDWDKTIMAPSNTFSFNLGANSVLVIPRQVGQTNVVINFVISNSSPIDVDAAEIVVTLPKELRCFPSFEWHKAWMPNEKIMGSPVSGPSQYTPVESKSLGMRSHTTLLHGDVAVLPGITNIALPIEHRWYFVSVMTKSKQSLPRLYAFNITFPAFKTNALPKPFYSTILTNSEGTMEWIKMPAGWEELKE